MSDVSMFVIAPGVLVWRTFEALYGLAVDCAQGAVNALDRVGVSNGADTETLNTALRTLRERPTRATEENTIIDVRTLYRRLGVLPSWSPVPITKDPALGTHAMTAKAVIAVFTALSALARSQRRRRSPRSESGHRLPACGRKRLAPVR